MIERPAPEIILSEDHLTNQMDQWDINLFDASENAKYVLVFSMIEKMGFMEKYEIANWQLSNCLHELNMAYSKDKNPFHNFVHGVGVCHAAYYL